MLRQERIQKGFPIKKGPNHDCEDFIVPGKCKTPTNFYLTEGTVGTLGHNSMGSTEQGHLRPWFLVMEAEGL